MAKRMRDRSRQGEMLEATMEANVSENDEWSDSNYDVDEERVIRERNRPMVPF